MLGSEAQVYLAHITLYCVRAPHTAASNQQNKNEQQ